MRGESERDKCTKKRMPLIYETIKALDAPPFVLDSGPAAEEEGDEEESKFGGRILEMDHCCCSKVLRAKFCHRRP